MMSAPTSVLDYMQMQGKKRDGCAKDVDKNGFESGEAGVETDVECSYITGENRPDKRVVRVSSRSFPKEHSHDATKPIRKVKCSQDQSKTSFGIHTLHNLSASLPLQRSRGLGFHSKENTSTSSSTTKNNWDGLTRTVLNFKPFSFKESPKSKKHTSRTDIKSQKRLPFASLDGNKISRTVANILTIPKKRRNAPPNSTNTSSSAIEQPTASTHQEKSSPVLPSQYMLFYLTPLVNAATTMLRLDAETSETASCNDAKPSGLAALSIKRQSSRLQSKKQTEKQTRSSSNHHDDNNSIASELHDSMEEEDFDLLGLLNAENVHDILSYFFSEVDIEDEIHEFQSSLEEEVNEIWEGIKFLQERLKQMTWSDGDVEKDEAETRRGNESLQHDFTDVINVVRSQMLEDRSILQQIENIEQLLSDLHTVSTNEQQKIAALTDRFAEEVNDAMTSIHATTNAIAGEISDDVAAQYRQLNNVKANDVLRKVLETILVDLHEISRLSISDIAEKQSQVLGESSCGLNLRGHEMQALLVPSREEDEFVVDYPKFRSEVKLLTEEAAVMETKVDVKGYWLTGPGEEMEEF
jgi:hypothetical protein